MKKCLILTLLILPAFHITAQLSGTYTIGGASPNFSTIKQAIDTLTLRGVSGKTTFHIRSGTYTQQLNVTAVAGVSAANTVHFIPDTSNTSPVIVSYTSGTSSANYVIQLQGSSRINFKGIRFQTGTGTYSRVLDLSGSTSNCTFDSCEFIGINISSSSTNYVVIINNSGTANQANQVEIKNSLIRYGSYGIYWYGGSSSIKEGGNKITGNTIVDFYTYGILSYYQDSIQISENIVRDKNIAATSYGISLYYSNYNTKVISNRVTLTNTSSLYGMYVYYCTGTSALPIQIHNNSIALASTSFTSSNYGIYHYNNEYVKYYFNSVHVASGNTTGRSLYAYSSSTSSYKNHDFRNNIFAHSAGGYSIEFSTNLVSGNGVSQSNFNDLYTTGTVLGIYGSTTCNNLNAWKTASGKDTNSVSANPDYTSSTDLHSSSINLYRKGSPIAGILYDFDGDLRNTSTPCIGADEFTVAAVDVAMLGLSNNKVCPGSSPVYIDFKNGGTDSLARTTFQWAVSVNSGSFVSQTSIHYIPGSKLSPGNTVSNFLLGNFTFTTGNTYTIRVISTNPNNTTDGKPQNDTILQSVTLAMGGRYTVGGTSPDYSTLTQAINALTTNGLCAAVVLAVRPGTYSGTTTINAIPGTSKVLSVTIRPDTAFTGTVLYNNTGQVIITNGASHIHFKSISFATSSSTSVIALNGMSENISFDSCLFTGTTTNSTSTTYSVIFGNTGTANIINNFRLTNSTLLNGSYGVYLYGGSTTVKESANVISGNTFTNFYSNGIMAYYQDSLEISNNTLTDRSAAATGYGIRAYYCDYGTSIKGNKIFLKQTTTKYGLMLSNSTGTIAAPLRVYNNAVSIGGTNNTTANYGIYINNCSYGKYSFNSVSMSSGSNTGRALYLYSSSTSLYKNHELLNNNFADFTGGYAVEYSTNLIAGNGIDRSNYNNFYSSGSVLGLYGSTQCSNLSSWKSTSQKDTNSHSVNPGFTAVDDLHASAISLFRTGISISYISNDFDGQPRHTTPCIGADEFVVAPVDIVVTGPVTANNCPGLSSVIVNFTNGGLDSIFRTTFQWAVSTNSGAFVSQSPVNYIPSVKLPSGGTVNGFNLGNFTFVNGNSYTIRIVSANPNNTTDGKPQNDTLLQTILLSMGGTYTVGGTSPSFNTLAQAFTALSNNGLCNHVVLSVRPGVHSGAIPINAISGSSATKTITVRPDPSFSGTVDLSNAGVLLPINNASFIRFVNITLRTTSVSQVVTLNGISTDISFDSCTFYGAKINSTSTNYSIIFGNTGTANVIHNFSLKNSRLNNGSYGAYLYGGSASIRERGHRIENNIINSFSYMGFMGYYLDSLRFANNTIQDSTYGQSQSIGVQLSYNYDALMIANNKISIFAGNTAYGLYMAYCYGTSSVLTPVFNNDIGMYNASATGNLYGMYLSYNNYPHYTNNTIRVEGGNTSSYGVYINYGSGGILQNNNLAVLTSSAAIFIQYSGTPGVVSNYNNLFSLLGGVGRLNGTLHSSLSSWRTASSMDANSKSVNPVFKFPGSGLPTAQALDSAANPVPFVNTDILGNARNTIKPDIGAFEYFLLQRNASLYNALGDTICPFGNITVGIKNLGIVRLNTLQVGYAISTNMGPFVTQSTSTISTALDPDSQKIFNVAYHNFALGNSYRIKIYGYLPNGSFDQNTTNDTIVAEVGVYPLPAVAVSNIPTFCSNDPIYFLTQGVPSGGWYTGPGAALTYFRPWIAGPGSHKIVYNYRDANNCTGKDSTTVVVYPKPNVSLPTFSGVCVDAAPFALSGGSPTGGVYKGPAVTGNTFNPHLAQGGKNRISYSITSSDNCIDSAIKYMPIHQLPVVTLSTLPVLCSHNGPVILVQGTPIGGVYTGTGTTSPSFDPQIAGAGTHSIVYTFTDTNNCSNRDTNSILVEAAPIISLGGTVTVCPKSPATLDAGNPGMIYLWSTGDNSQTIKVTQAGTFWVEVTDPATAKACKNADTVQVNMEDVCTGINAVHKGATRFKVYPNPGNGQFVISAIGLPPGNYAIEVTDFHGAFVYKEIIKTHNSETGFQISLRDVATGTYLLRFSGDGFYYHMPLIKH